MRVDSGYRDSDVGSTRCEKPGRIDGLKGVLDLISDLIFCCEMGAGSVTN